MAPAPVMGSKRVSPCYVGIGAWIPAKAKNKELAAQAVRDFVSMVTHDLKTPLTTIAGTTSILRESWSDLDEQDLQQLLDGLHRNSDVMTRMVQDLLLVSRAEAGELDPNRERVEVNQALRNIVASFEEGIDLSLPDEPLFIEIDRYHLDRIVSNLISNAIKFTASGAVPRMRWPSSPSWPSRPRTRRAGNASISTATSGPSG